MKQVKLNLMAIIGMMVAVGTVTFTKASTLALQWYEVIPHPTNQLYDEIGPVTSNPTQGGNCAEVADPVRCAIQLDLSNASQIPETVEEAENDRLVLVGRSTFKPQQ